MISALTRLADWSARTPKRLWAIAFALFFTLAASWSAATPSAAPRTNTPTSSGPPPSPGARLAAPR